jgi:hypothetical protein
VERERAAGLDGALSVRKGRLARAKRTALKRSATGLRSDRQRRALARVVDEDHNAHIRRARDRECIVAIRLIRRWLAELPRAAEFETRTTALEDEASRAVHPTTSRGICRSPCPLHFHYHVTADSARLRTCR